MSNSNVFTGQNLKLKRKHLKEYLFCQNKITKSILEHGSKFPQRGFEDSPIKRFIIFSVSLSWSPGSACLR